MSNVWKAYEQIMADKIVKTAEKKADTDYDVKVPAAGPDTPVEETGYDLVEIAHPEQIQVSNSQLNDGIVENGVERQKVMIDVALRNPRGVIAELIDVLVKAANVLDDEGEYKMAAEVDVFIEKVAQVSAPGAGYTTTLTPLDIKRVQVSQLQKFMPAVEEALTRIKDLDWTTFIWGKGDKARQEAKAVVDNAQEHLQSFLDTSGTDALIASANELAQFVHANYDLVLKSMRQSTDWINDQDEAKSAWQYLEGLSKRWLSAIGQPAAATGQPSAITQPSAMTQPGATTTHGRPAPGAMTSRRPSTPGQGAHNYSVGGPSDPTGDKLVRELQELLGLSGKSLDGKFGPETFAAVQQEASHDVELEYYLNGYPGLKGSYHGWSPTAVQYAINAIKSYRSKPGQAQQMTSPTTVGKDIQTYDAGVAKKQQEAAKIQKDLEDAASAATGAF